MKTDPRLHRAYHFREPSPLTVEIHDPDCGCPACLPWLQPAPAEARALTLGDIGALVWAGLAIGTTIAFAWDAHGAWLALTTVFGGAVMLKFKFAAVATDHAKRCGFPVEDMLGTIPHMLTIDDPAGAVEQIDRAYRNVGGGWRDSDSERFTLDLDRGLLRYPGDPALRLIANANLRSERILIFDGAWVAIVQPDGSARVARID